MSTEAPPGAQSVPEPEVLTTGMEPLSDRTKRTLLVGLIVLAVLLAGFATWRLWPRPPAPFSLSDLQGVYAGMVRSDGTNDASVLSKENFADSPASVDPAACEPLFEATTFSMFPAGALDGVGTYWPNEQVAISLFSFRFADPAAAQAQLERIAAALAVCADHPMQILPRGRAEPPTTRINAQSGVVSRLADAPLAGVTRQAGYLFNTDDDVKFAVNVFVYNNVVSWQFRYDPRSGTYDPTAADRLDTSLATQLRSVEESRG